MDITLSIAANHVARVVDAICAVYDYDANQQGGESRGAFSKRMTIAWLKELTLSHEAVDAAETARLAALEGEEPTIT